MNVTSSGMLHLLLLCCAHRQTRARPPHRDITDTTAHSVTSPANSVTSHANSVTSHANSVTSHANSVTSHASSVTSHASSVTSHASSVTSHASSVTSRVIRVASDADSVIRGISAVMRDTPDENSVIRDISAVMRDTPDENSVIRDIFAVMRDTPDDDSVIKHAATNRGRTRTARNLPVFPNPAVDNYEIHVEPEDFLQLDPAESIVAAVAMAALSTMLLFGFLPIRIGDEQIQERYETNPYNSNQLYRRRLPTNQVHWPCITGNRCRRKTRPRWRRTRYQ